MLEVLGGFTVFLILLMLLMFYFQRSEDKESVQQLRRKHSPTLREFNRFNSIRSEIGEALSPDFYNRKVREILNDPLEKDIADLEIELSHLGEILSKFRVVRNIKKEIDQGMTAKDNEDQLDLYYATINQLKGYNQQRIDQQYQTLRRDRERLEKLRDKKYREKYMDLIPKRDEKEHLDDLDEINI